MDKSLSYLNILYNGFIYIILFIRVSLTANHSQPLFVLISNWIKGIPIKLIIKTIPNIIKTTIKPLINFALNKNHSSTYIMLHNVGNISTLFVCHLSQINSFIYYNIFFVKMKAPCSWFLYNRQNYFFFQFWVFVNNGLALLTCYVIV